LSEDDADFRMLADLDAQPAIKVRFEHASQGFVLVTAETTFTKRGFGRQPHTWPVTIVPSRYQGIYEGGMWLCFPVTPYQLAYSHAWQGWMDSDVECMAWWGRVHKENWLIGVGSSPSAAYESLIERTCDRACVDMKDFFQEPSWDRDTLTE
jgi:hypothetical protein